ncbi:L-ascorbate metabolism protein UlaG (beta-lactamase superfamily) [Thermocatellispora tengchongensis]|uniref:L-ascorbate metabolism protein UlaG (Beta-lactamase superfamily) n=1 Tax=Thermocatellispora tengchongensis TaxID=1073253 RepID=A0A840P0U6_9ACTN|nr:MBL fold metallo-hydrolase [Thermocatellispora tengchongensis]MBB5132599.1 L-ascorbate metabolism protein UlaG (beta-lactamase superfamily) [Thermocatellispora tengchongensis]
MKLTKYTHACVRLEKDGRVLVIDPGSFSEAEALDGADAVLITHEHFDHLDPERLARLPATAEIWTCEAVAGRLTEVAATVRTVRDGDGFETAGFRVDVVGEWHALNHPDMPIVQNVGFKVDGDVYYPGDAFTLPGGEVGTLLVPMTAPWLKLPEVIEFLRTVRPARAYSTHDGIYNETGLKLVDTWLGMEAGKQRADIRRLTPGESVEL